jgi:hypothetical protein
MLDSIKFEKISQGSAGFRENMENGQFWPNPAEPSEIFSNFMKSNISFG